MVLNTVQMDVKPAQQINSLVAPQKDHVTLVDPQHTGLTVPLVMLAMPSALDAIQMALVRGVNLQIILLTTQIRVALNAPLIAPPAMLQGSA